MATERLSMRTIREILRHKWAVGLSHREVATSLGISVGAVCAAEQRARTAGLDHWTAVEALDDQALEARLYGVTLHSLLRIPGLPFSHWVAEKHVAG